MLKLCTSSWNVSGRQPLLPPSKGVDWRPGCLFFVDAVFILLICLCPAQSGPTELYISTDPDGLGPLYQPHNLLALHQRGGGEHFKRYKVLKMFEKKKI